MTERVIFTGSDIADVVIALQHYAMHLENNNLFASAANQYDLAAHAARALGWHPQAGWLSTSAAECRSRWRATQQQQTALEGWTHV